MGNRKIIRITKHLEITKNQFISNSQYPVTVQNKFYKANKAEQKIYTVGINKYQVVLNYKFPGIYLQQKSILLQVLALFQ